MGCAVQGSLLDRGVGSLSFSQLQVPPIGPGQVLGSVDGVLTVNHPVLAACLAGGTGGSATITGIAGGSSRLFPPGTSLTVQLALAAGGQETAMITGSNGRVVVLTGAAGTSRFGLVIRTI